MINKKSLKDVFEVNKNHLLYQIKKYLSNKNREKKEKIDESRKYTINNIIKENFEQAIRFLEVLREYKQGIIIHKVFTPRLPPIVIRDARSCNHKIIRGTESFEIRYLNLIRSSLDIINIENKNNLTPKIIDNAVNFIRNFQFQNIYRSQVDIKHRFQIALNDLILLLENSGIKDALHKLDVSKDFQNFNDIHADVVTISSLEDGNKNYILFEAEVALRGLTTKQIQEYKRILKGSKNEPEWYKELPIWEQELCKKYTYKIVQRKHVISSQLRQIVGMRNAFEKITGIVTDVTVENFEIKILHQSKHAGCLASFSRHKRSRQYIANLNAEQAQEWVGSGITVHCNTFNSGPNRGKESDKMIVRQTIKAMEHIKGRITNTSYDSFRVSPGANFYNGANYLIDRILNSLNRIKQLSYITSYIESQNENRKIFPKNKINDHLKLLWDDNVIGAKTHTALSILIDMKDKIKMSEKGSPGFLNMEISISLNILQNIINGIALPSGSEFKGMNKKEFPKEEILNMCALGLDRTGFSEHIQSVKSLENIVLNQVDYLDSKIIASGHTSQLAGATYFGGGSIGCYGLKEDSVVYFPEKRLKELSSLLELSASGNNLTIGLEYAVSPLF